MEPLQWNTLEEAASWLAEKTSESWTPRRVLDHALTCSKTYGNVRESRLKARLPKGTKLGLYQRAADQEQHERRLVREYTNQWSHFPLHSSQLEDLLLHGETAASCAVHMDANADAPSNLAYIEPLGDEFIVTMDIVGVTKDDLLWLEQWYTPQIFQDLISGKQPAGMCHWTIKWLTQDRAMEWLKRPWSVGQVHWLFHGMELLNQNHVNIPPAIASGDAVERLLGAIRTGLLKPNGQDEKGEPVYSPEDVIQVAEDVDFGCWQMWKTLSDADKYASPAAKKGDKRRTYCSKGEILGADWHLPKNKSLEGALSDVPRWLEDAVVCRGKRGGNSTTWNPAMVAFCLMSTTGKKKWTVPKYRLDDTMKANFSEWLDEWKKYNSQD